MRRKTWISLILVFFVTLGFLYNFLSKSNEENTESPKPTATSSPSNEVNNNDATIVDIISPYMMNENYGQLYQAYSLNQKDYLVESQWSGSAYDEAFTSNLILMMHNDNGKVTTEQLNSGSYLVHLFKENGSPFLRLSKTDDAQVVVFYEVSQLNRYPQHAYVYKMKSDSTLELIYQSEGVFESFTRSSSGDLLLVEKTYDDNKNQYPTAFKPYILHHLSYHDGTFKEDSSERIDPNTDGAKIKTTD